MVVVVIMIDARVFFKGHTAQVVFGSSNLAVKNYCKRSGAAGHLLRWQNLYVASHQ